MTSSAGVLGVGREEVLLALLRGGSRSEYEAAFEELFTLFRGQVLALCLHITGSRADAEDAAQDVFLALHRSLRSFRGDSRLSTWVFRIAVRAAVRVKARRSSASNPAGRQARTALPGEEEMRAIHRVTASRLLAALARLSLEHRVVLSLFALRGLTHAEIAEILGVPVGTVWSRLHQARQRLGTLLEGEAVQGRF
jgi:RNA polymerase sigma-70 factor (ECF subfamily)